MVKLIQLSGMARVRRFVANRTFCPRPSQNAVAKNCWRTLCLSLAGVLFAGQAGVALAHGLDEARFQLPVPWNKPHITQVMALGYNELGVEFDHPQASIKTIAGRQCVVANMVSFNVDDKYAYDVDEPVVLTITYAPAETTAPLIRAYWDKNGGDAHGTLDIKNEPGQQFRTVEVTLDRARLAGLGAAETDISVGAPRGLVALCDIAIARSGATRALPATGTVHLQVWDPVLRKDVPARVGLYDATGRLPMPGEQALVINRFADAVRRHWVNERTIWPSQNRQAFYIDGSYESAVPAGRYELVVTRGPEYRAYHSYFEVRPGEPTDVKVELERFQDLPASGWFSGESHLHLRRNDVFDHNVWAQAAAEDLHLSNLLQMGNIARTYFDQPAWGKAGRFEQDGYILVSGQEAPRTGHRGHTIQWNIQGPLRHAPDGFFSYHDIFAEAHKQGGLTGYAHLGELFNATRGLALDVPFGLVDFIEVLQGGRLETGIWYDFLNLGYRINPVAGSDYPFFGPTLPGVERTYVRVDGPLTADKWYDGFRHGRAFVTNGPFIDLKVNGHGIGDELHVARGTRLDISAVATLNPDADTLDRAELVVLGDVAAQVPANGATKVELHHEIVADRSMWIAFRAYGKRNEKWNTTVAHSAPIYVVVDDAPTWKAEDVRALVEKERNSLRELVAEPIDPREDLEAFETGELLKSEWKAQLPTIKSRVAEAEARYDELLQRLAKSTGK